MAKTIFDLCTARDIAAYWEVLKQDEDPFPGEELFPAEKQLGITTKWLSGQRGLPQVLNLSAFDVHAVPRPRIGFNSLKADMPFFKESKYIDEEMRQELNRIMATGNQSYIDAVMNRVFDDEMSLIRAARAARERMRMLALTTGVVAITANGQYVSYDYGIPNGHKGEAATTWATQGADPVEDIRVAKEQIADDTGAVITRAMCDGATWRKIRNDEGLKKSIFVLSGGVGTISDRALKEYLQEELSISVYVNDKRYVNESGQTVKYMPANTFVMFPDGELGKTMFGTTPEESDLMSSAVSNVSITDTGVAITTMRHEDPVNVETKVSQICLPTFTAANQVYILSTTHTG